MKWITHLEGGPKRVNHAAVAVNHKIYTFGGYCTGQNSRKYKSMDVHVLNTTTFRWTRHPVSNLPYFENDDILPFKRYGHTAVVYGNKVYIWGGRNDKASCSVLFCFDTEWHCWTAPKTTGTIPMGRDGHSACVWKNYMIVFGGYEDESATFAKTMYYLDLDKMHWSYVPPKGVHPIVRDFHTAVCINDRMYLFGGRGTVYAPNMPEEEVYSNELWYLDLNHFEWHLVCANGDIPIGRRSHSAFVYNEKMYIFGGYNSLLEQHFNDLNEFDPRTNTWRRLDISGTPPCERRRQACIPVGEQVFVFGGTSPNPKRTEPDEPGMIDLDEKLVDHSDMYVLDFKPTLKTLSMIAVKSSNQEKRVLLHTLRDELFNMFSPNNITVKRPKPNNSAG
ncbi:kelch domain-containing protein 3 [Aethina tumida]|uniref:kelch domain-containing protein 3 n=1 Tax=Aethina tumida TaxID=116153 RepID=UPI00096B39EF|nr:kelch domain-containing protein 3 [Aethina tumida]XP_019875995.1 kelch domain-containing protein 3 [Aethina tumida]